ncbi:MAG: amino acid transporter, partial [SAR324 cluster bacterium]|nr:amino acid transporter [SAR324 cluster bacterium]
AMATVLLVYQIGQPRIWMAMSRDGLLPPIFSSIHPRFHTPWFSTLVTGVMVAVPALFMNLTEVTDLTSIGTLFAFVLVCSGVLVLQEKEKSLSSTPRGGFRIPYFNSKYIVPALVLIGIAIFLALVFDEGKNFSYSSQYLYSVLPMSIFLILACMVAFICFKRELSLIPVLGLLCCLYLITQLGLTNWLRFAIWLLIGLFLYFAYGNRHSKLQKKTIH